ncbi:MAG: hypothetical protein ACLPKI_19065 [Streptosporangiaceae bacterium]
MNDDELITVLREQRKIVMTTPVEQIISRGRSVRARRRVPQAAGALGAAAAAAVAVSLALPASHPAASHPAASHPAGGPGVRLAAWTITRLADGSIKVTFREAADPAGLQRTLRADGVPASVTFTGHQNPACQPYSSPARQAFWPYGPRTGPLGWSRFINHPKNAYTTPYALVIDPSALPSGAGLQIWTSGTPGAADNFQLHVSLVKAGPQCTGSSRS